MHHLLLLLRHETFIAFTVTIKLSIMFTFSFSSVVFLVSSLSGLTFPVLTFSVFAFSVFAFSSLVLLPAISDPVSRWSF